ncbi:MAG: type I pullulanase, partial [Clostridium sp.]
MNKIIKYCKIDTFNEITFSLYRLMEQSIVIKANKEVIDTKEYILSLNYNTKVGKIKFNNEIDITVEYGICIGKVEKIATMGDIFSTKEFKEKYHYEGNLGCEYRKNNTEFIIWAPTANNVDLLIYNKDSTQKLNMKKGNKGQWSLILQGNYKDKFYNYLVKVHDCENVVVDPYAKAVGVNGEKSMVVDLESTNPNGWELDKRPDLLCATDAILYEMHVRDFSIDKNSGVDESQKGKYLGLVQENTTLPESNIKTTLDHLKELGITHVHLLPVFDYKSVNEEAISSKEFNWGYDPQNYNALEGSYSTNPFDGNIRIEEFKEAVLKFHKAGIRVVMDVVYNHTFDTKTNCLNLAVPFYYYRVDGSGEFSNASACGNETASERSMFKRYMIDSVKYFAKEYHIDGFRFDLMAIHDLDVMKEIRLELNNIDKSIIIYGEGWTAMESPLPKENAAFKTNTVKYGDMQIACFSDDMRDGIKGDTFIAERSGFVNGSIGQEETIKSGVVASINHKDVNYGKWTYSYEPWASQPYQTINYDSAHDNYTLWDKLNLSRPEATKEDLIKMNKLAAAIVLTSQGISFLHSGEEFLRSKVREDGSFEENSYKSPDSVNKIDWNRKKEYIEVFNYYKGLIKLRKTYKEFRLSSAKDINEKITFLQKGKEFNEDLIVAFKIKGDEDIIVIYNANNKYVEVRIEEGIWVVLVNDEISGENTINEISGGLVKVNPISCYVIKKIK